MTDQLIATTMTEEMFRAVLREELDRRQRGKTVYQQLAKGLEEEIKSFDGVEHQSGAHPNGTPWAYDVRYTYSHVVYSALSALLRAIYKTRTAGRLPPEHQEEMKQFMTEVLALMRRYRTKFEAGEAQG